MASVINIILLPLFSLLVVPLLFIAGIVYAILNADYAVYIFGLVDELIGFTICLIDMANQYFEPLTLPLNTTLQFMMLVAVSLMLLLPKYVPGRYIAVIIAMGLVFKIMPFDKTSEYQVTVFDVGQGLSVIFELNDVTVLYDTGAGWGDGSMFNLVVAPYLQSKQIKHIDVVVISHNDNDHAGGLIDLLNTVSVGQIYTGQPLTDDDISADECHGNQLHWPDVALFFIPLELAGSTKSNNHSCVMKVLIGQHSILLPGDIERDAEMLLVDDTSGQIKVDILLAPHHGSISSSSWPFIKKVNPEVVIYSAGYLNQFNHPHQTVVNRYKAMAALDYTTANDGALRITGFEHDSLQVEGWASSKRYYWQ